MKITIRPSRNKKNAKRGRVEIVLSVNATEMSELHICSFSLLSKMIFLRILQKVNNATLYIENHLQCNQKLKVNGNMNMLGHIF